MTGPARKRVRKRGTTSFSRYRRHKRPKPTVEEPSLEERKSICAEYESFNEVGEDYWLVQDILRHRRGRRKGTFEYLVLWADHPRTGQRFPPEWLASDKVTEPAKEEYWAKLTAEDNKAAEGDQTLKKTDGEEKPKGQENPKGEGNLKCEGNPERERVSEGEDAAGREDAVESEDQDIPEDIPVDNGEPDTSYVPSTLIQSKNVSGSARLASEEFSEKANFYSSSEPSAQPKSVRPRDRSSRSKTTELHAPVSQEFSNQDRGKSGDRTEEAHTLVSPSPESHPSLPAEPPAADTTLSSTSPRPRGPGEQLLGFSSISSFGHSPTLSSASKSLDRGSVPSFFLPEEGGLRVEEIARRFWDPSYRPAFMRPRFCAEDPAFTNMDLPTDSTVNPPAEQLSETAMVRSNAAPMSIYDVTLGSALPIQDSIEEEEHTSNGERFSSESKTSSSQQSVENERNAIQIAELVQPSLPILGPSEYAIALPCEGKINSTYSDIIKAKEKSIKKFISRHESIGSSNGSLNRAQERNEMNELVQRLHDTVTHMDLGLPGISTQHSLESQELAAYTNYASSKFSFLGHLVNMLKTTDCSILIMAREGPVQDLLEQYLKMKQVIVKRPDRIARSKSPTPDRLTTDFQVELVSTWSTHELAIYPRPVLMIAFDASFDSQDPQVARIRSQRSERQHELMPVLHLLVANSSEHVDRCLPKSMPSHQRLKTLVRVTYQAWPNLGGKPKSLPLPSEEPEGRPMDFTDIQLSIRKGLERRLVMLAGLVTQAAISPNFDANWKLGLMPELHLQLTELEEPPSKRSGATTRAETPKEALARSGTPASRADTPSGRKRLLDVESFLPALQKRQRLTPLRDSAEASGRIDAQYQLAHLQDHVKKLEAELETARDARRKAEQDRDHAHEHLAQWKQDHANLQRRYEKRMTKCHELEKQKQKLLKTMENSRTRNERIAESDAALRQKIAELQKELAAVREEIKAGGGDAAAVELAREETRTLLAKNSGLEKSLENTRKDFEFTRTQYQEASNKAVDLANQVKDLEEEVTNLTKQAGDEKRRLREINYEDSIKRHLDKISEIRLECKSRDMLLRKLEEENRLLKRNRGIQTRGSSVQPPGSPGLDGHGGSRTRSRQGSPAPGLFANSHHNSVANRGSLLRHER
ncbi:uncharacterized protein Z519_06574 [Cladophialophora bantiana CBS 173.52]|uniref:Chromo domain-containing protein n=1 Tax=Cladophialophora bantiana (strain ATCC 10958 / CBS 173.52 / CDC B-1940 / NIH 8579) TaxID=1442370 RepID=A0A0D2ES31_CLAB1|nr:uncharacterized protein Z519_06574 [Cladophialophora bantiana CBS 173.52]KIW92726.1 hypothetical protein Z519_06574 [Cladophialophora bantiana CBS 173.52]